MTKFLAARIPDDLMQAIDKIADDNKMSRTDVVITALYDVIGRDTAEARLNRIADRLEEMLNRGSVSDSKRVEKKPKQSHRQVQKKAPTASDESSYTPTEAELVIIELSKSGMKNVGIADHLNERGFTTIKGLAWDNLKVRDAKSRLKKRGLL